jgi:prepilin signal peptidase PulO-like enzyme (type II secretory pathway)
MTAVSTGSFGTLAAIFLALGAAFTFGLGVAFTTFRATFFAGFTWTGRFLADAATFPGFVVAVVFAFLAAVFSAFTAAHRFL